MSDAELRRLHLFELEDQPWFPGWLRTYLTRYLEALHRTFGTAEPLARLVVRALRESGARAIVDLCSGHAGPQRDVLERVRSEAGLEGVTLELSDLYPDAALVARCAAGEWPGVSYRAEPVDAANAAALPDGLRTMVCSLHHMRPDDARALLASAARDRQPFLAYELSDNSAPRALWWTAVPFAGLLTWVLTPLVRPLGLGQLLTTYVVPLVPICVGWDGAVSNVRTYGAGDLEKLLEDVPSDGYRWETGVIAGRLGKQLYLLGLPTISS